MNAESSPRSNPATMILVIGLFVAPIVIAWLYVNEVFSWREQGMVNHGTLVTPPVDISQLGDHKGVQPLLALAPSNWAMLILVPGQCAEQCSDVLDRMLTIRSLLGQGAARVSVHAIAATAPASGVHSNRVEREPTGVAALTNALAMRELPVAPPLIALIDWRHQLMMVYPFNASSRDIQRDLKRLLRASEIR